MSMLASPRKITNAKL